MVKRKKALKQKSKKTAEIKQESKKMGTAGQNIPVPAIAIKILSGILAVIMIIALTLYVLGRMPARGFWTLAVILGVLAFVIIPSMRKKFVEGY